MLRKMSATPLTGVICCLLLVSWASAVEDDERKLPENDNREREYFEFYMRESTHSEKGCNMELARMCFLGLSNGTLTAMVTSNAEKKKQACEMVWKTKMCLEGVLTSCPEDQRENKILDPYVPLLASIAETACNDRMEKGKDDDNEDEEGEENERRESGPRGCDLDLVGMCLSGFFYTAVGVSSRTSPFTFTDGLCWQAGKSLSCLSATMPKCHHPKLRSLVSMAAAQLKMTQEATCEKSKGCNFDRAMASMMAYKNAVDSPMVQMEGSPLSCSVLSVTLQMTMDDLKDCPQDVYTMVSGGIYLMSKTAEVVCRGKYPGIEMKSVPMLDEVISLGAIVNSPYASKANVCPLFEMAMKKLMSMKSEDVKSMDVMNLMDTSMRMMGELCADQKMWANLMNLTKMNDPLRPCMFKESSMCDVDRARVCVAQSQLDALLGDVEMFGWEPVCHGIEKMTRCVQYMLNGCKNFSKMAIEKISPKAREVFSLAADHCPVKTLLEVRGSCYPTKCDIQKALSCFSVPTESDIRSGQACSFINTTVSCIDKHTDGCGYLESAHPVNFALKRYLDWLKPYCMDVMLDSVLQMLPECNVRYMDGFNFIFTHSTNFPQDFCSFHMHMSEECEDESDLSVFSRYNNAKLYSRGAMISWMCERKSNIKMMNETMLKQRMEELYMESKNIPEKEMMQYAMGGSCITSYFHRLMQFTSLPIQQRKALCSDIEYTKMCVHENFANASEARQQSVREAMKFVMMMHKQVCPMEMMEMPAMDNSCNVNASLRCLGMLGHYLSTASAFHAESQCSGVKKAMHCVRNNSMNCTASEKAVVKEAMESILSLTGSACKPETEEECNVTKALIGQFVPETCDQTAVNNCFEWFNKAKEYYISTNNTMALCSMGQQAVMCAQANSRSCAAAYIANSVTAPIQTLKAELQNVCTEMFSDREAKMKDNSTEKCEVPPAVVPCVGNTEMCFNSLVPSEICGNQTSIKACISLMMRGCDKYLVYSSTTSIKMNQQSLADAINATCDLTPSSTLPTMPSNFSQDMMCMAGNDVFTNYLFNNSATQRDLCKVFTKMSDCIMGNSSAVSLPRRKTLESISQVVKKQVYFRCNVVENLNMAYMDDGKNASEFDIPQNSTCDPMTASLCMYNYAATNLYTAFYPINEREQACRKRKGDITCMQKSLAGCPSATRMKVFQVLDWFNSIGKGIGVCNEEPQRKCQPKEAMNCVSMLSQGIMAYGMTEQAPVVCSGIVPTEMCVMENTMGCEAGVRASVEDAYRDVSAVAVKTCQTDGKKLMQISVREDTCDMKKAKMCLMGMFDKVAMTTVSMEKVNNRKLCSELHRMAECVEKHSMSCGEMDKMKMASHKPLIMGLLMGTCSNEEEEETYESGHCKMTAVRCLRDYVQISTMDSLSDYCMQVPPTLKCLSSTVKNCGKKMQGLLGMAMDHIEETSGGVCKSKGCNSHLATMCMTEAGAMLKMPPQTFTESPLWCGFVKQALKCAEMHGRSCDMKKSPLSEAWYNSSVWMMHVLCEEGPSPNAVLSVAPAFQLEGLFSLLALLGNPHSTKETICPHYTNMMTSIYEAAFVLSPEMYAQMIQVHRLPIKTVGYLCANKEENYTMSDRKATCDVRAAYKCAEEAEIHAKITSSIFLGWEPVCQSLEKMTCCVQSVTSECMDHDSILAVTSQFHEIYAAVGDKCSPRDISARVMRSCPMPIPKKCEVTNAINNCLLDIRTESDKQQICSKLPEVVKCVKDHTEGCAATQNAPLEWILRKYKEWRQSSCDLSRVDTAVMVKDETSDSANCSLVFMENVYRGLTTKTDLLEVMCSASEEEEKCMKKAKYIPLAMQFYFTEDVEKYQEFKKMCNRTFTSKPAPSEPTSCMLDMAAMCLVPYYQGLMNWRMTPMSDRPSMCGLILDVHMCVNVSTQTCSKQRQDMFRSGLAAVTMQHDEVCPSILPAMKKMDYVCTPEVASMCIQHYGWYLSQATPTKRGEACRKFQDTMECVHLSTKNCSDSQKAAFGSSLEQARNLLGDSCPLLSSIMCNTDMWESTLAHSRCNRSKAEYCLMELDKYSKANMTNMGGMCMKYAGTLECVLQNTMTCDPDDVEDINVTMHVVMSTLGRECMKLAAESKTGNSGMEEKSFPLLAALQTCQPQPVCRTRWLDCAPDMNVTVVCNNGEKIAKCMLERTAGCDNGTRLSIAQDVRMFAEEIAKFHKGGKCNFTEFVVERTERLVPYMYNNSCYLQFSRNLTAVMRNMSATHWDICRILNQTQHCVQGESMYLPALLQGVWKAAAHKIDLNKCYAGYAEAMMKMNMSKEEMKMIAMENWDASQLYNRTMNESSACDLNLAHSCLQYLGSHAVFGGATPMVDRKGVCRDIAQSQECVVRSSMMCSPRNQMKVLNTAKMFNNLIQSQGFCLDAKDVAKDSFRAEVMKMECNEKEAMQCLGMFSLSISQQYYTDSKSAVCSHLLPVEICIAKNTLNCMSSVRKSIEATYMNLKTLAKGLCSSKSRMAETKTSNDHCLSDMPKESTVCSVPDALYCITSTQAKIRKMADKKEAVCGMLPELRSCVWKFVGGCEKCQQDTVYWTMHDIFQRFSKVCPTATCDPCAARWCASQLNMTMRRDDRNGMRENMTKMEDKEVSCVDIWKTRQCMDMSLSGCAREESHHVREVLEKKLAPMVPKSCHQKLQFSECALHFAVMAQRILGVTEDMMPKAVLTEVHEMMEAYMKNMPKPPTYEEQLKALKSLIKMAGSMVKSETCPHKSDGWPWGLPEDKPTQCKEAMSAAHCMGTHIQQLPKDKIPLVNASLHLIGQLLMDKCDKKPLRCFSCKNAKSNEECNMQPMETCVGPNQMCYTVTTLKPKNGTTNNNRTSNSTREKRDAHGREPMPEDHGWISKGCTRRVPLLQQDTQCLSGGKCEYGCYKQDCNYMPHSGIRDDRSCDPKMAAICGMHLVSDLLSMKRTDCGKVKKQMMCMYHHTAQCLSSSDQQMYKYALQLASKPELVRCYAEQESCTCGRCQLLTLTNLVQNPLLSRDQVCHAAYEAQTVAMKSVMTQECTKEDVHNIYETAKLWGPMLGDMCNPPNIAEMLGKKKYNMTCSQEAADMCRAVTPWEHEFEDRNDTRVCGMVTKMFYCVYLHIAGCEWTEADMTRSMAWMASVVTPLKNRCDFSALEKAINTTRDSKAPYNAEQTKAMFKIAMEEGTVKDKELMSNMKALQKTMNMVEKQYICKPSVALHNCFFYMENVAPADFCGAANKTHACIDLMTRDCNPLQRAPVSYVFGNILYANPQQCGIGSTPTAEEARDPWYQLRGCAATYSMAVQRSYAAPPTKDQMMEMCAAAITLDRCVYYTDISLTAKPMVSNMAMLTKELIDASCNQLPMDMTNVECDKDDVVCMVAKNMSKPVQWQDPPTEPSSCEAGYAAACLSNYLMRILTWPFSPLGETKDICWERLYMEECVVSKTASCTYNRKQTFLMAVDWFRNITGPGCSVVTKMDTMAVNCSRAMECVETGLYLLTRRESYKDMDGFCWGASQIAKCIEAHASSCSPQEMVNIREGVEIMGNVTHFYCPHLDASICPLTKMEGTTPGAKCQANNMRMCVSKFYEQTHENAALTEQQFCGIVSQTTDCVMRNSSNCHPGTVNEIKQMIVPGLLMANVNCSIISQMYMSYTNCPIVGNCSIAMAMDKITQAIAQSLVPGVSKCNLYFTLENELKQPACFPVENTIINRALQQFADYLTTTYNCPKQTANLQTSGVVFDNSDLAKCTREMGGDLSIALTNPVYGTWDICQSATKYHGCLKTLFSKATSTREKFITMTMKQTYMDVEKFVNGTCAAMNMTNLKPVTMPAEAATCAKDVAVGCVLSFSMQAMHVTQLRPEDSEKLCRSRMDYYHCMKNASSSCSLGFTSQLQTMLTLADSILMSSGQCPEDVIEESQKQKADMWAELIYGQARKDLTIKLIMEVMEDRIEDKQDEDRKEMDDEEDRKEMDDEEDGKEMDDDEEDGKEKDKEDGKENDKERMADSHDKEEKKNCDPRMASRCLMYFSTYLLKDEMSELPSRCRDLVNATSCVWNNVKGCDHATQYMAMNTMKQSVHYAKKMCMLILPNMMRLAHLPDSKKMEVGRMIMSYKMPESVREEVSEMMRNLTMKDKNSMMDKMEKEEGEMNKMEEENMEKREMMHKMEKMFESTDHVSEVRERVKAFMAEGGRMDDNLEGVMKLLRVAPEDGMCVDPAKYREAGRCDPAMAMECMMSVDKELLSPMSTRDRLCVKHNIATRCYATMSVGCDYITSTMLNVTLNLMMYKVGDKCETRIASPCRTRTEMRCEVKEAEECLEGLHRVVVAGKDFLPSSAAQMCMVAQMSKKCLMEKLAHCDTKTSYGFHDALRPVVKTLDYVCHTMPALGCVTSFLWKTASSVLLSADLAKVGSALQTMKFYKDQNMTMPDAVRDQMMKEMEDKMNGSRSEAMTMYAGWLGRMVGKAPECMKEEDKKYGMEAVLTSVSTLIKLTMMESGLVRADKHFVEHVEMMINMDDEDSVLRMAIGAINRTLVEHKMKLNHSLLIRTAVKEIVQMADSTKMLQFFYAKMTKGMLMRTMEKMGMKMKVDEEAEKEMEMEMQRWMVAEIADKVREMMPNMTKMMTSADYTMGYLSKAVKAMEMKKWASCSELAETAKCLEMYSHLIPAESRVTVNVTMNALFAVVKEVCEPAKCFQCNGLTNNEECNKQGIATCQPGQGCMTTIIDRKIYKGCVYPSADYRDENMDYKTCYGSWCNQPMMTTHKEKDPMCQPYAAIQCGLDLVPSLVLNRAPNLRDIYKATWCMDSHTSRCMYRQNQAVSQLGQIIKHTALEGACAGDASQYECGLRNVLALAATINKPAISRAALCYDLNETLSLIRTAEAHNKCSEYDSIAVYEGMSTIMQTIGHDYCPGLVIKDNSSCAMMKKMMEGEDKESECEVEDVRECMEEHELLHSLVMMSDYEKMKAARGARARDFDQVCMELFLTSQCVTSKVKGCSQKVQLDVTANMTKKLEFFIRRCPVSKIMHEMCSPLPMPDPVCDIVKTRTCFGRFDSENEQLCNVDMSDFTSTLTCITNNTSGCSAVQAVPVFDKVFDVIAKMTMKCSGLTKVLQDDQMVYKMTKEMVAKMVMEYNVMMKMENDNRPMSGLLSSMLAAKYAQKTHNMTAEAVFASMSPVLQNITMVMEGAVQLSLSGDDTQGVAVCMLDYTAGFRRALMYPDWFSLVFCEAISEFQSCLSRQKLSPVVQSNVLSILNDISGDASMACGNYMEQVMWKGWMLINMTQRLSKPIHDKIDELYKNMMNGTQDKMNLTAKDVASMLDASISSVVDPMIGGNESCDVYKIASVISGFSVQLLGPFTPLSQYPVLCDMLNNSVRAQLEPLISKCPSAHQMLYKSVMGSIVNMTRPICYQPAMNRVQSPAVCKVDEAFGCYMAVFPYLSGKAAPQDKLCRAYHYATACVDKHTVTCTADQKMGLSYVENYVRSVIGDTCPFVQALRQCYTSDNRYTCDVPKAKECLASLGDYSKGITKQTCSKLPQLMQCIGSATSGCSTADTHDVASYLDVVMSAYRILPVCYSYNMSSLLYQSCQAPRTCSLEKAGLCYAPLMTKTSCTVQEASSIRSCAASHLRGCNLIQLQIFDSQLWFGRENMPSCNAFTMDTSVVPSALTVEAQGLSQCSTAFLKNITTALQSSANSLERICMSMKMIYSECLMKNQTEDGIKFLTALYGHSFAVAMELTDKVCKDVYEGKVPMEAKSSDKTSCDTKVAAQCLSAVSIPVIFSASLNRADKLSFCSGQTFQACMSVVQSTLVGCSMEETEQLRSFRTFLENIKEFSGVCEDHFVTCAPMDAMTCGMEAAEKMKMMAERNKTTVTDKNPYCSHFESTMDCVRSNVFGCSKEIKMEVRKSTEEGFCLFSDVLKSCKMMRMEEPKMELPKCMKEKHTAPVCNVTAASMCLKYLYWELESPFVDCNSMHETYTHAMQCYMENIGNCTPGQVMITNHMLSIVHEAVEELCPMIPGHSCQEPASCELDQAAYCVHSLGHLMSTNGSMENGHMCMAVEMTEACVYDKTRRCSMFGKGAVNYAMTEMKDKAAESRKLSCTDSLELCMMKFYYSSLGVLQGEMMMTQLSKMRDHVTSQMMLDMTLGKDPMMRMKQWNMTMDNVSSSIVDKMSKEMEKSMKKTMKDDKTSEGRMIAYDMHILDVMTRGLKTHEDKYLKVKSLQCTGFRHAFSCVLNNLQTSSGLRSDVAGLIAGVGSRLYVVISNLCEKERSCDLGKEPETCQILPAATLIMEQAGSFANMKSFCDMLPHTVQNVTMWTQSCMDDSMSYQFQKMVAEMNEAKDTMCRSQEACQQADAQKCIADFRSNPNCSSYESALQCVTEKLKSCDGETVQRVERELQSEYEKIAASCVSMPDLMMNINSKAALRLIEGGTEESLNLKLSESPAEKCEAGKTCEVKVKLQLKNNPASTPMCADSQERIPQVVVFKDPDVADPCTFTFTSDNWEKGTQIPLLASSDMLYDRVQDVNLSLVVDKYSDSQLVLSRQMADVKLVVADTDQPAFCSASDSYIVSFDGKAFKNRYRGEFTLYKHSTMPYEVRILNQACASRSKTCTCAAMVKVQDDVLVVDVCSKVQSSALDVPVKLFRNGDLAQGTRIYQDNGGQLIVVDLPTAGLVAIQMENNKRLSVFVIPSSLDWRRSEGLCGVYDSNKNNDMAMPVTGSLTNNVAHFIKGWRNKAGDSLYLGALPEPSYQPPMYCSCTGGSSVVENQCEPMLISKTCKLTSGKDVTAELVELSNSGEGRRKKRAAFNAWEGLTGVDETYDPQDTELVVSVSGNWNTTTAGDFCDSLMLSSALMDKCQTLVGTSFTQAMKDICVQTILTNDGTSGVEVESIIKVQCEAQLDKMAPTMTTDPNFQTLSSEILTLVCPNDCSNNGQCEGGQCKCFRDYIGADCSIQESAAPAITSLEADGLCPLQNGGCKTVLVAGGPFSEELSPKCHFQRAEMSTTGFSVTGSIVQSAAQFVTSTLLICTVPDSLLAAAGVGVSAVSVAVSNNGQAVSPAKFFISYNPVCYSCNNNSQCMKTTTGCVIGGKCYAASAVNPQSICKFCDPVTNTSDWTSKIVAGCPGSGAPQTTTPSDPNGQSGQGQNQPCSTPAPKVEQDQTLAVILGAFAGLFFLTTVVMGCKACRTSGSSGKSSGSNSIEDPKEYDNIGYSGYRKQNVYGAGPIVEDVPTKPDLGTFGKSVDNAAFENEASSTPL